MTRLDRLDVHGFRGIVSSTLPFDGGSIVLGGANGSGKTAFVDALEFFYSGSVAHLSGIAGLGLKAHGAHVLADARESRVTAFFEDPDESATRWLTGPVDAPGALDVHIERGSRLAFILRRAQLQAFIHAKPADRYRTLAELVGLETLDHLQTVLKRAHDVLDRSALDAEAELASVERRLAEQADDVPDEAQLLALLNEALADLGMGDMRLDSLDEIPTVRQSLVRRLRSAAPDPRVRARAELASALAGMETTRLREALAAYIELTPSSRDRGSRTEMLELLGLLTRARDLVRHDPEIDHCPVCASNVQPRVLLASLVNRITGLEEVSLLQQRLDRSREGLDASLQDTAARLRSLVRLATAAEFSTQVMETLSNGIAMLRESLRADAPAQTHEMTGRLEAALDRWALWADEAIKRLTPDAGETEDAVTDDVSAALAALESAAAQRAQIARMQEERRRSEGRRAELTALIGRRRQSAEVARRVSETFTRVRNREIQALFDALEADLVRFYDTLHPGEGFHALSIAMDLKKRSSTDLRLGFYDKDAEDPRAFASEGHLDSLGLCIFLAFVRRFNGDWPLLVLDDVVATVDAAHKTRVARLLFEEFGDRQLTITTHDGRWFNELRKAQTDCGIENVQNLVIEEWTLEGGPTLRPAA